MLDVFEQFELAARDSGTAFPLVPRLLLSIDRSGGAEAAHATVALASRLRAEGGVGRYVAGMDFSVLTLTLALALALALALTLTLTITLTLTLTLTRTLTRYVVGIDFSGNPTVSGFAQFAEAFAAARGAGLHAVVHAAEVANDADTDAILAFRPDRLGDTLHS